MINYIYGWFKTANIFAFTGYMLIKLLHIKYFNHDDESCSIKIEQIKQKWSDGIFSRMNINLEIRGQPDSNATILVGNHLSYLDIPAIFKAKNVSFVSKAEVKKWPIIGVAATLAKTIYVDRKSMRSREETFKQIAHQTEKGQRIVLFPSGTTSITDKKKWKQGAFKIAQYQNLKIQVFRIKYSPLRKSAYIDDDFILTHIMNLARSFEHKHCIVEFGGTFSVSNISDDIERTQKWCRLDSWA